MELPYTLTPLPSHIEFAVQVQAVRPQSQPLNNHKGQVRDDRAPLFHADKVQQLQDFSAPAGMCMLGDMHGSLSLYC